MEKTETKKISRERRKALLKRLDSYTLPNKRYLYSVSALGYIQFLTRIISFGLVAKAFEQIYTNQNVDFLALVIVLVILNIVGFAAATMAKRYQGIVSQRARNQMKAEFFNAFEKQPLEDGTRADVLTIASQGIDTLDTYFGVYLNQNMRAYLNCATVLAIVAWLFPIGSLIFIISLPFIPVSIILIQKRSRQIMQHYWATYMDVGNLFMDDLKGLNTLYTYQADEVYANDFAQKAEAFRQSTMQLLSFQLQSVGYMDAVMYVGVALSGFVASNYFLQGQLSLFTVIFFVLIASEFFMPIREAGYGMHLVMMNTKMADRLFNFLDSIDNEEEQEKGTRAPIEKITLDQLSYGFNDKVLVNNVSLTIEKGELLAICGVSGRGKSTLAKILHKKVPYQAGDVQFNEQSIQNWSKQDLFNEIVYVSPENYIFSDTIYANLAMATNYSKEQLSAWLIERNLLSFVQQLPDGLDTLVGENGQLLSPGQRQQLILVRALLGDFSVYIFDEMTSSVDKENEKLLIDIIQQIAAEHIVLFISHKMKHVVQMDKVLFIGKQGVAIDNPQNLLNTVTEFKELYQTQHELEVILDGTSES